MAEGATFAVPRPPPSWIVEVFGDDACILHALRNIQEPIHAASLADAPPSLADALHDVVPAGKVKSASVGLGKSTLLPLPGRSKALSDSSNSKDGRESAAGRGGSQNASERPRLVLFAVLGERTLELATGKGRETC